ncbi:MAG: hypothetical protein HGA75_17755, partial [Thiobacillus sp.]|nr:hypothetical protein [Thiobacillus sp.]
QEFAPGFGTPMASRYFSTKWVKKHNLMQTDEEQEEMMKDIEADEKEAQKFMPSPEEMIQQQAQQPVQQNSNQTQQPQCSHPLIPPP